MEYWKSIRVIKNNLKKLSNIAHFTSATLISQIGQKKFL